MELILGLPPMSQYDASATPMYSAFQPTPDAAPFTRCPARVPLDEMNAPTALGRARRRCAMNFDEADMAPELELNEIIWRVGARRRLADAAAKKGCVYGGTGAMNQNRERFMWFMGSWGSWVGCQRSGSQCGFSMNR